MSSPSPTRGSSTSLPSVEATRRRLVASLVAGVGLGSTGYIAAITVATLVVTDLAGDSAWAGVPGATVVLGSAAWSALLSALMARRGRRLGLAVGYAIGAAGALVVAFAVISRSLPLLLAGTFAMGSANASNLLSRYTAADLFPVSRRASAIGIVVWGATLGAIVGPNLATPAGHLAMSVGLPMLSGPYLVLVVFVGAASLLSFALLRPDPYELADESAVRADGSAASAPSEGGATAPASIRELLGRPTVLAALVALVAGQVVMVLIMTMTPLHMTEHGHGLEAVGLVISGHTFGMYALAPVSGRLTDRFGSLRVIFAGLTTLAVAAVMAAVAPPDGGQVLFVALFLLGFGWNLGFVAGSTLLASGLAIADRTRLEGATDALVWSASAAASLSSGVVMAAAGFTSLGLVALGLICLPAWFLLGRRHAIRAATSG